MAALRSGRGNMGMRDTMLATYLFLFKDEGMLFSHLLLK